MSHLPDNDPRHGTPNGYVNYRCRCDQCREANTAYIKERRIGAYRQDACGCGQLKSYRATLCAACRRREAFVEHGISAYQHRGCRCDVCREASAKAKREWRKTAAA